MYYDKLYQFWEILNLILLRNKGNGLIVIGYLFYFRYLIKFMNKVDRKYNDNDNKIVNNIY